MRRLGILIKDDGEALPKFNRWSKLVENIKDTLVTIYMTQPYVFALPYKCLGHHSFSLIFSLEISCVVN